MKKKLSLILCILFMLNLFVPVSFTAKAGTNRTKVVIKSINVDRTRVAGSESVIITCSVEDPNIVSSIAVTYINPAGIDRGISLNLQNGKFVGKFDINPSDVPGVWKIKNVAMADKDYRADYLYNTTLDLPWGPSADLSSGNFEVYGTGGTNPEFKSLSLDKTLVNLNQLVKIRVEATDRTAPLANTASISYTQPNWYTGEYTLNLVSQSVSNGVHTGVYEGVLQASSSGVWKVDKIKLKNTAWKEAIVANAAYHPYARDFSAYDITVSNTAAAGPAVIDSNVANYSTNLAPVDTLWFKFDKNITLGAYSPSTVTDESGNKVLLTEIVEGNMLKLKLSGTLQHDKRYTVKIPSYQIIGEDGPYLDKDYVVTFATGKTDTVGYGVKRYITSNTEINSNVSVAGSVVISPGVTLKIKKGAALSVTKDVIVYGSLVNEGSITVNGSAYVNNYNNVQGGTPGTEAGKFTDTGSKNMQNMVVGKYPKPEMAVKPDADGDIAEYTASVTVTGVPLMQYEINDIKRTMSAEGIGQYAYSLNYGINKLVIRVKDPFGNSTEKTVTLNNTAAALKITGTYPVDGSGDIPVNTAAVFEFNKDAVAGPDYGSIKMTDSSGNNVKVVLAVEDGMLVVYPEQDLKYNSTYTVTVPPYSMSAVGANNYLDNYKISFTTGNEVNRFAGADRYETSLNILKGGWHASDYAVLATGEDFPDALSAAPLAAKYNAPILLTNPKTLSPGLEAELTGLGVKEIFIIGGVGAVSKDIENKLAQKGIKCTRLSGKDRYETSAAIAGYIGNSSHVFVVTGENFPDALSIASYAASKGMPILLSGRDSLPASVGKYIADNNISNAYIVGGTGVISSKVEKSFSWSKRIGGSNRYETNINVLAEFGDEFDFTYTYFATGENFPDALSGSALAALGASPIILVDKSIPQDVVDNIKHNKEIMKMKYVLGGEGVIPGSLISKVLNSL